MSEDDNPFKDDPDYQKMKDAALADQKRMRNDWHNIMNDDSGSGKRIIIDLLNECGYMRSVFDKHNSEMCKNVGRSEIGFYIQTNLSRFAPEALIEIMTKDSNLFANED